MADADARLLAWPGLWNARDLGGLTGPRGVTVRPGAVVRSDDPHLVDAEGWEQVHAHGIRTIVDLRRTAQLDERPYRPPSDIAVRHVSLEEDLHEDAEFVAWQAAGWAATPLYYPGFLARWPDRLAEAVRAVATAPPGGVLVHCRKGSDRTGLVVLLMLAAVGVDPEAIVDDHLATMTRSSSEQARALGWEDDTALLEAVLETAGTTARGSLLSTLEGLDAPTYLRQAGLTAAELNRLRARLLHR